MSLKVFNVLGMQIAELVNDYQNAGIYKVQFDAADLRDGIYLYRFEAIGNSKSFSKSDIMILAK